MVLDYPPSLEKSRSPVSTFSVLECRVHFVYIVRCADGTLYTGYARDPRARVVVHNRGRGARYTSGRRPVRLVYSEECESHGAALAMVTSEALTGGGRRP